MNKQYPATPREKKQKVSMKANANKVLAKKTFLRSGEWADAINKRPKTVPVAIAHPVKGASAREAAKTLAAFTNNITDLGDTGDHYKTRESRKFG